MRSRLVQLGMLSHFQPLSTQMAPLAPGLQIQQVTMLAGHVLLRLVSTAPTAPCPDCGTCSRSLHSRYTRSVADLPWGPLTVQILLAVRKFRCSLTSCPRRVFSERLPRVVAPYARHTLRRHAVLRALALALGGRAAERLAHQLQFPASRDSLLRLLQQTPLPTYFPPRVIGVDDWAFRRRQYYGTIVVDLERRQPIALLADRQADTLVAWLHQHPTVRVISRDRAGAYAEAARRGALQALQVADRWHLLKNLWETLERYFLNKRKLLKEAIPESTAPVVGDTAPARSQDATILTPGPLSPQRPAVLRQKRHTAYLERYAQIHALRAKALDAVSIAQQLGVSRTTVHRYLQLREPPAPKQPRVYQSRLLRAYETYLRQRWAEGCRNAKQLWREIAAQGYAYSSHTVERFVGRLRQASGTARRFRAVAPLSVSERKQVARVPQPYTPRQIASLLVGRAEQRTTWQQGYLTRLGAADPETAVVLHLVTEFTRMVRQREGDQLDAWLVQVIERGPRELQRFADRLQTDYRAVQAGLTEQWSQGQTEGQIHRLKYIKRQMYGRAGLGLLRQRVLQRPGPRDGPACFHADRTAGPS
jgi:transposase